VSDEKDPKDSEDVGMIPPHFSPVRFMWAKGNHEEYKAFGSLAEARAHPDGAMIMEADSGGQILVTCPVSKVHARNRS